MKYKNIFKPYRRLVIIFIIFSLPLVICLITESNYFYYILKNNTLGDTKELICFVSILLTLPAMFADLMLGLILYPRSGSVGGTPLMYVFIVLNLLFYAILVNKLIEKKQKRTIKTK